ncbi:class I SAM-dependent methyltransferase [Saccharopolyspora elongata]|uniref:Class I SAM-dependent methyltransferase n=1 Tax=Saccharopolyspora elongata TaxID=2530387 RepID=A0A4R4YAC5_9PSEU|nr:class I SAM-dependent methyltransferase [Saccharopolyspora elongata]TDD41366.1 class I SAM-dependent methyltransferase [Saccharopolyspora elongata]
MTRPGDLRSRSLLYRNPSWYDELLSGATAPVEAVQALVADYRPDARTVLEFGCGTGRDLAHLAAAGFECIGIELQPEMVDYARHQHPGLTVEVGDMRSIRLSVTADILLCLGNSLAYNHTDRDMHEAFATFAAHAQPNALLVLFTPVAPPPPEAANLAVSRVDTDTIHAEVTTRVVWDDQTQTTTMYRDWVLDNGEHHTDVIQRRILTREQLTTHLTRAGFELLEQFADPGQRHTNDDRRARSAFTAARYCA